MTDAECNPISELLMVFVDRRDVAVALGKEIDGLAADLDRALSSAAEGARLPRACNTM
jgi:hypothetical protein